MVSNQIYGSLGSIQDCLFLYTGTCGTTKNKGGNLLYTAICEFTANIYYRHIYSPEGTVWTVFIV